MSKKKLEEFEKRIKELEDKIEADNMYENILEAYGVPKSSEKGFLRQMLDCRKEYEAQMEELKKLTGKNPLLGSGKFVSCGFGHCMWVPDYKKISCEKIIYNEIYSEEVVERLKEENKKLREEKRQFELSLALKNGALKVRGNKIKELKEENRDAEAHVEELIDSISQLEYDKIMLEAIVKPGESSLKRDVRGQIKSAEKGGYNQAIDDVLDEVGHKDGKVYAQVLINMKKK